MLGYFACYLTFGAKTTIEHGLAPLKLIGGHWAVELGADREKKGFFLISTTKRATYIAKQLSIPSNRKTDGTNSWEVHDFDWGGVPIHNVGCIVGDIKSSAQEHGLSIVGVIGLDILEKIKLVLDFESLTAALSTDSIEYRSELIRKTDGRKTNSISQYQCKVDADELQADLSAIGLPNDTRIDLSRSIALVNLVKSGSNGIRSTYIESRGLEERNFPQYIATKSIGVNGLILAIPNNEQPYALSISRFDFHARKVGIDLANSKIHAICDDETEQNDLRLSHFLGIPVKVRDSKLLIAGFKVRPLIDPFLKQYFEEEIIEIGGIQTTDILSAWQTPSAQGKDKVLTELSKALTGTYKLVLIVDGKHRTMEIRGFRY